MNIKWISTTSKFYSDPTAWDSGTVPTASDVAVWDSSSSGDCTLDAPITVGGLNFCGHAGAIKPNNRAITIGLLDRLMTPGKLAESNQMKFIGTLKK